MPMFSPVFFSGGVFFHRHRDDKAPSIAHAQYGEWSFKTTAEHAAAFSVSRRSGKVRDATARVYPTEGQTTMIGACCLGSNCLQTWHFHFCKARSSKRISADRTDHTTTIAMSTNRGARQTFDEHSEEAK